MTREEFEGTLVNAREFGGLGLDIYFSNLLIHDAEQRAVIERLDQLTAMQDGGIRSLHEQIVQKDA